ncbi:MAG: DUF4450 domain-containing protein [Tannerellaceae bacterium]|nr:DUF4450 domain-containing protein [Tannerellaceae bacterium]
MNTKLKQKNKSNSPFEKLGRWIGILLFLFLWSNLHATDPNPPFKGKRGGVFYMPEQAGQLTFGLVVGNESKWLSETRSRKSSVVKNIAGACLYEIGDPLLGKGTLLFTVVPLKDSQGVIVEVEGRQLPSGTFLLWSHGGASGAIHPAGNEPAVKPEDCIYNVFSVEESALTLYYGESMNLKVIQAVMPVTSDIRLADERQKESPLVYFHSGKKTGTPSLAGLLPLQEEKKEYFCVYRQNERADYNRFMLPALFEQLTIPFASLLRNFKSDHSLKGGENEK